jgi:hypothetical protein
MPKWTSLRNEYSLIFGAFMILLCSGCLGPSFESLSPHKGGEYGVDVVRGNIPPAQLKDSWLWVRGRVVGDIDRQKNAKGEMQEEEVILVTRQRGNTQNPGPSVEAYLNVIDRTPVTGRRTLRSQIKLFTVASTQKKPTLPKLAYGVVSPGPLDNGRIELVDLDGNGTLEILTRISRRLTKGYLVYHNAYSVNGAKLTKIFSAQAIQQTPELLHMDLDKDGRDELIVQNMVLINNSKNGGTIRPTWPSVYSQSKGINTYSQQDKKFANHYDETLLLFYEDHAHSIFTKQSYQVQEFYIGVIYAYRNNLTLAHMFLEEAQKGQGPTARLAKDFIKTLPAKRFAKPKGEASPNNQRAELIR